MFPLTLGGLEKGMRRLSHSGSAAALV
jgi:hypothetical protein